MATNNTKSPTFEDKVIQDNSPDLQDFRRAIKNLDNLESRRSVGQRQNEQEEIYCNRSSQERVINTNSMLGILSLYHETCSSPVNDYPQNRHIDQVIKNFYRMKPVKKKVG